MSKTREKKPLFYKVYFGLLIAFAVILSAALVVTYFALSDFESTRPKNYAESIFETYFKKGDYIGLLNECGAEENPFENRKDVKKEISRSYDKDKLSYITVYSDNPSVYNYQVLYDNTPIGTFTLENNGIKNSFGFEGCELKKAEISNGFGTVTIKALSDARVFVNGEPVGDEYLTESEVKSPSWDFMPQGVNGITYKIYTIDNFLCKPEIKIKSSLGEHPVKYNEDEKTFEAELIYDKKLEKEYSEYCIEAIKNYAIYMQKDGKRANALKYIDKNSELYYNVSSSLVQFVNDHSGYSFENESASEFYAYDENTFSCRVVMDHCLYRSKTDTYKDHIDMTIYLRKVGNKYLIYKW